MDGQFTTAWPPGDAVPPLHRIEPSGPARGRLQAIAERLSLGPFPADPAQAGQIRAAQIAAIRRLTPLAMLAAGLALLLLLVVLGRDAALRPPLLLWGGAVLVGVLYSLRGRIPARSRPSPTPAAQPASPRAIRRATLHAGLCAAPWALLPVLTLPDAPLTAQILVVGLCAVLMLFGGFVLAPVPLAACCYVGLVTAGTVSALWAEGTPLHLGLAALFCLAALTVGVHLVSHSRLFVARCLAEARLCAEVSARTTAQASAEQAQLLTALGEMAGGMAHDFNNILHLVAGNAAVIAHRLDTSAEAPLDGDGAGQVRQLAGAILDAAERGGAISRRLLTFARPERLLAETLDPAAFLEDAGRLLRPLLDRRITLRIEAAPGLPRLLANRAQLEIVLVNLATNARDAMPDGGSLVLAAAPEGRPVFGADRQVTPGGFLRLSVRDTGAGMDAATLARAAEPFFTTKPPGRGTGLGLALAKGFAEQSGGGFAIDSAPGLGTTVMLWLPATLAPAAAPPAAAPPAAFAGGLPAAQPGCPACHVLVVDADAAVRYSTIRSLADAGYVVSAADNGAAALAGLDRGEAVDLLLTDYAMADMTGVALINAAHRRRPGLPAILLTGYMGEVPAAETDAAFIVLRKPMPPAELAARLAAILPVRHGVTG